jgi:UDP-glucose 4-epimerase
VLTRAPASASQVARVFETSSPSVDLVIHFAAVAFVGESVADPLRYYHNITSASATRPAMRAIHLPM